MGSYYDYPYPVYLERPGFEDDPYWDDLTIEEQKLIAKQRAYMCQDEDSSNG